MLAYMRRARMTLSSCPLKGIVVCGVIRSTQCNLELKHAPLRGPRIKAMLYLISHM